MSCVHRVANMSMNRDTIVAISAYDTTSRRRRQGAPSAQPQNIFLAAKTKHQLRSTLSATESAKGGGVVSNAIRIRVHITHRSRVLSS